MLDDTQTAVGLIRHGQRLHAEIHSAFWRRTIGQYGRRRIVKIRKLRHHGHETHHACEVVGTESPQRKVRPIQFRDLYFTELSPLNRSDVGRIEFHLIDVAVSSELAPSFADLRLQQIHGQPSQSSTGLRGFHRDSESANRTSPT